MIFMMIIYMVLKKMVLELFPGCASPCWFLNVFKPQDSATVVTSILQSKQTHVFDDKTVEMQSFASDNSTDLPQVAA